jgi:hypothetical protein
MNTSGFFVMLVVVFVLACVAWTLWELSPFAHHEESYRDPVTGKRRFETPHLETRDEFEHRTNTAH